MTGKELLIALGDINPKYYEEAEQEGIATEISHRGLRRPLLIAAMIALMALLVGCAMVYVLRLQDIIIGQRVYTPIDTSQSAEERTHISLQGYVGSPGYQASKEWYGFRETYRYPENEPEIPMEQRLDYLAYGCFYPEEIAKVDEICEKYGLQKLGYAWIEETVDITFDALEIQGLALPDAEAQVEYMWNQAYYYRDGTFDIGFTLKLTGEDPVWTDALDLRMRYVQKTSFDGVYGQLGPIESYEQWHYTTGQDVDVLLARSEKNAMMIVDREDAFLTVHIQNADDSITFPNKQVLEAVAQMLDLRVTPGTVDVDAAQARYDATAKRLEEERLARKEQNRTFEGYIQKKIDEWWGSSQGKICAFADLDGDGTDEMLLGSEEQFLGIYMMTDDGVVSIPGLWDDGTGRTVYPCENSVILITKENDSAKAHTFYRYENGRATEIVTVSYFFGTEEEAPYRRYWMDTAGEIQWESISREEYESVISGYRVMEVTPMKVDDFLAQ